MRRAAKIGCHWVAWNAMVLAVQYTSGMLYWYACTAPPWDLEHVWRALVLTWSPSVGCLLLNQAVLHPEHLPVQRTHPAGRRPPRGRPRRRGGQSHTQTRRGEEYGLALALGLDLARSGGGWVGETDLRSLLYFIDG